MIAHVNFNLHLFPRLLVNLLFGRGSLGFVLLWVAYLYLLPSCQFMRYLFTIDRHCHVSCFHKKPRTPSLSLILWIFTPGTFSFIRLCISCNLMPALLSQFPLFSDTFPVAPAQAWLSPEGTASLSSVSLTEMDTWQGQLSLSFSFSALSPASKTVLSTK